MVGTSGRMGARLALVTASARRRPARICGAAPGIAMHPSGTWFPTVAATAGPAPLYGTLVVSSLSVRRSSVADRSGVVPIPGVAKLYFFPAL